MKKLLMVLVGLMFICNANSGGCWDVPKLNQLKDIQNQLKDTLKGKKEQSPPASKSVQTKPEPTVTKQVFFDKAEDTYRQYKNLSHLSANFRNPNLSTVISDILKHYYNVQLNYSNHRRILTDIENWMNNYYPKSPSAKHQKKWIAKQCKKKRIDSSKIFSFMDDFASHIDGIKGEMEREKRDEKQAYAEMRAEEQHMQEEKRQKDAVERAAKRQSELDKVAEDQRKAEEADRAEYEQREAARTARIAQIKSKVDNAIREYNSRKTLKLTKELRELLSGVWVNRQDYQLLVDLVSLQKRVFTFEAKFPIVIIGYKDHSVKVLITDQTGNVKYGSDGLPVGMVIRAIERPDGTYLLGMRLLTGLNNYGEQEDVYSFIKDLN